MSEPVLKLENVTMQFGGVVAVDDLSMEVRQGEIVALIGPNGAGKTTAFNVVTGVYAPTNGCLYLDGKPYLCEHPAGKAKKTYLGSDADKFARHPTLRKTPDQITKMGLARTFQNIRLFREMSVIENLLVAQHTQVNRHLLAGILNTRGYRQAENQALDRAFYWLEVVEMVDCANRLAGTLSYGQQRRLEIARAMCTRPEMICLDEPAAGLNPVETQALSRIIRFLRQQHGITVLLIEHDMGMVMEISDHIIVLDHGDVIARGAPQAIQANASVIAAYLGAEEEETRR